VKLAFLIFLFSTLLPISGAFAADLPPSVPAAHLQAAKQAKEHFDRGNYREAEKIYEGILTAEPNNLYTLSNLGVVHFRSGKLKLAEEVFRRAITVAPNDAFSHCTLGIVYYSQARYDDAIKSLQRAIELNPKNAAAHNYLGITYAQKGMHEEANKELEKARELDPIYDYKPEKPPKEIFEKPSRMSPNHALHLVRNLH
jgi:Flp pilus assembly protein TadD